MNDESNNKKDKIPPATFGGDTPKEDEVNMDPHDLARLKSQIEASFGAFCKTGEVEAVKDGETVKEMISDFDPEVVIAIKASENGSEARVVIATMKPNISAAAAQTIEDFRLGMRDSYMRSRIARGEDPASVIAETLGIDKDSIREARMGDEDGESEADPQPKKTSKKKAEPDNPFEVKPPKGKLH